MEMMYVFNYTKYHSEELLNKQYFCLLFFFSIINVSYQESFNSFYIILYYYPNTNGFKI